jgi:hypothetical protein
MGRSITTVRKLEIRRRRYPSIFRIEVMNSIVAHVTQVNTIVDGADETTNLEAIFPNLIWDDVVSIVPQVG